MLFGDKHMKDWEIRDEWAKRAKGLPGIVLRMSAVDKLEENGAVMIFRKKKIELGDCFWVKECFGIEEKFGTEYGGYPYEYDSLNYIPEFFGKGAGDRYYAVHRVYCPDSEVKDWGRWFPPSQLPWVFGRVIVQAVKIEPLKDGLKAITLKKVYDKYE
jgi:hypothetical protein